MVTHTIWQTEQSSVTTRTTQMKPCPGKKNEKKRKKKCTKLLHYKLSENNSYQKGDGGKSKQINK